MSASPSLQFSWEVFKGKVRMLSSATLSAIIIFFNHLQADIHVFIFNFEFSDVCTDRFLLMSYKQMHKTAWLVCDWKTSKCIPRLTLLYKIFDLMSYTYYKLNVFSLYKDITFFQENNHSISAQISTLPLVAMRGHCKLRVSERKTEQTLLVTHFVAFWIH